jgi:hypothetical protein
MSTEVEARGPIDRHLLRMRLTAAIMLAMVAVAAAASFLVPYRGSPAASPLALTVVAAVASLWVGLSATGDAERRLERIRRAFAVHGEERRLLRDHWLVYGVVMLRLGLMAVAGVLVSLWGLGPRIGIWLIVLCGLMMLLTWPTRRKVQLLLGRARALRD